MCCLKNSYNDTTTLPAPEKIYQKKYSNNNYGLYIIFLLSLFFILIYFYFS